MMGPVVAGSGTCAKNLPYGCAGMNPFALRLRPGLNTTTNIVIADKNASAGRTAKPFLKLIGANHADA